MQRAFHSVDSLSEQVERSIFEICDLPAQERASRAEHFCAQHPQHADAMRSILSAVTNPERSVAALEAAGPASGGTDDPTRYGMVCEIARGGMGVIMLAHDWKMRRDLAVKMPRSCMHAGPGVVGTALRRRLFAEARITGRLEHPGIVPVHDLGMDEHGVPYFTMRLVRGRTADQVFALARAGTDGWGIARALEVLLKVCDTLAYAHEHGVIHRDIKPGNVMIGGHGEVYVMDWGLAKAEDCTDEPAASNGAAVDCNPAHGTVTGSVLGTPSFMPPEQATGHLDALGPTADVYATGAMLYSLLTGRAPYKEAWSTPTNETLAAVRRGPPTPIRCLAPRSPSRLVAICEKAMARDPAHRYPSAAMLAADLRAYLDGRVVQAFRTGIGAELAAWVRRNRSLAASLVVTAATVIAGLAIVGAASDGKHPARLNANPRRPLAVIVEGDIATAAEPR